MTRKGWLLTGPCFQQLHKAVEVQAGSLLERVSETRPVDFIVD